MPPLIPRSKKLRTALLAGASIVLVVVVALVLASTADSGAKQTAKAKAKAKARVAAEAKALKLVLGPVVVQNTGLPTAVKPPVRAAVMRATQQYLDAAILAPVNNSQVDNRYERVFDPGVKGLAAGTQRAVLTEAETRYLIRKPVAMKASQVRVDALGDPTGKPALVSTTFFLTIYTKTPTGQQLVIRRHTELTFADEFGQWLVTAYRVNVRRSVDGKTTTTTAQSRPGTSS